MLGNCANPYTYMNGADICVQPSSYEGYSVAVFEEKYFKKPVICSTIGSFYEMIADGENGLIINRDSNSIYQAVKYLLDNPEKIAEFGNTPALNFVEKQTTIKELEKTF